MNEFVALLLVTISRPRLPDARHDHFGPPQTAAVPRSKIAVSIPEFQDAKEGITRLLRCYQTDADFSDAKRLNQPAKIEALQEEIKKMRRAPRPRLRSIQVKIISLRTKKAYERKGEEAR